MNISWSRQLCPAEFTKRSATWFQPHCLFVLKLSQEKKMKLQAFLRVVCLWFQQEPATIAWFGIRLGPTTFGIFDAFPDEAGRQAHLNGKVAAALMAKAGELLSQPPSIEKVEVLAAKLDDGAAKKAA